MPTFLSTVVADTFRASSLPEVDASASIAAVRPDDLAASFGIELGDPGRSLVGAISGGKPSTTSSVELGGEATKHALYSKESSTRAWKEIDYGESPPNMIVAPDASSALDPAREAARFERNDVRPPLITRGPLIRPEEPEPLQGWAESASNHAAAMPSSTGLVGAAGMALTGDLMSGEMHSVGHAGALARSREPAEASPSVDPVPAAHSRQSWGGSAWTGRSNRAAFPTASIDGPREAAQPTLRTGRLQRASPAGSVSESPQVSSAEPAVQIDQIDIFVAPSQQAVATGASLPVSSGTHISAVYLRRI